MRGKISEPRCVLAAVERKSRYTCLGVLTQPTADLTATLLSKTLAPFKVRSITFDNGTEFARYASACNALAAKPYFAEINQQQLCVAPNPAVHTDAAR